MLSRPIPNKVFISITLFLLSGVIAAIYNHILLSLPQYVLATDSNHCHPRFLSHMLQGLITLTNLSYYQLLSLITWVLNTPSMSSIDFWHTFRSVSLWVLTTLVMGSHPFVHAFLLVMSQVQLFHVS